MPRKGKAKREGGSYRDPEAYLDYAQAGAAEERGYSLTAGTNFTSQAAAASFSLTADRKAAALPLGDGDDADLLPQRASALRWDRKTKRVVRGDGTGADNKKLIRTESGVRLPASFHSGRFDAWRSAQRVHLPKIGEAELPRAKSFAPIPGRQYRHKAGIPRAGRPDPSDVKAGGPRRGGPPGKARSSLQRGARPGAAPGGLRTVDQIAKERRQKEKRVRRSTQPSKKPVKGHGGGKGREGRSAGGSGGGRGGRGGGGRGGKRR
jgi:ATP-dependent RNA helicase DDX54/DBP10